MTEREKRLARSAAWRALTKGGRITRSACETCGNPKAEMHHDDYSRRIDIRWLCRQCHSAHHVGQGNLPPTSIRVPRTVKNPIAYLIVRGFTLIRLAKEWGYSSTASIGLLRNFEYVPPADRAAKMAATLGWKSAGQVIDYWAERVIARDAAKARS